jgi:hypothetical protein
VKNRAAKGQRWIEATGKQARFCKTASHACGESRARIREQSKVSDGLKQLGNRHGFAKPPAMHAVRVEGEEESSQRSAMDWSNRETGTVLQNRQPCMR